MADISTEQIKALREETGVSVMQCKKALEEAEGDAEKALMILRKKSKEIAEKKSDRALKSGVVSAYIHAGGSVGSMVELLCETDFVAKNEEFQALAYDIAMHIAAMNPEFLGEEDIPENAREKAKEILSGEVEGLPAQAGKPEDMKEKILSGKLDAYFKDRVLLKQSYIKDQGRTIEDLVKEGVQKFGENIEIGRFSRFAI